MRQHIVYIARALDGSWVASNPTDTEEKARMQIEAHEPDPSRYNAYQILAELLGRVLGGRTAGVKAIVRHKMVKWDGDPPIPEDASEHPEKYPQVAEVIEGGDGIETKVIYRRS